MARDIDLNLLRVLDTLLAERSVTRTGQVLGRSQPAVSNALQRLRAALGDDLLVRGPDGLVPTPRAEALRGPLRDAMALMADVLRAGAAFDPAASSALFRISTPDRQSLAVVPSLVTRLQKLAPATTLHVMTADRQHALDLLDDDRTDLALGWIDGEPHHLRHEVLIEESLYCVFRRGHPLLARRRRLDIAGVLSFPHVVVSATGTRTAIFDDLLAARGLSRRALVTVSNFTAVPQLLAGSDMVGVFTRLAARVFDSAFGLATRPVPLDVGRLPTRMVWHARFDRDPAHAWLREQVRTIYRDFRS
ncbi:LysR family transcriptional regulator [Rhodoplanes serenus]|uniref:LysR family transcriptional regulator n=1 Tax=Rhodoplanes serenus TaxID=200615 RepID=A0A9X5ARD4_9BRAD|nr:LysR family transcriptional regulator [Rhodoplanes serenus]MTW15020.1 LysR family transcriptional regulator [Rhodoplanes serenus]